MTAEKKTQGFVLLVMLAGLASLALAWEAAPRFPGLWAFSIFVVAAFLIELTSNPLRLGAVGSASFIIHLASGILFGGFWGGLVVAVSTALFQLHLGNPPIKVVFNVSQRTLCIVAAVLVYTAVGGSLPPAYLGFDVDFRVLAVRKDFALFYVLAAVYFAINTVVLNMVIAISSDRKFSEVWSLNARGVLGYDLAASSIGLALVLLYDGLEQWRGVGALGFLLVLAPILAIRHIYGLYRKLQSSGRELLDLMVKAIEARDPYTSGHSIRVATLAKAIAQEAKMSADDVEEVYTAAVLHDVGKIHEEFAPLLRKESKLTPEETALLQTHPVKSAELVGIISSFRGAILNAVRSHHERWDGGGYPDGLAGEAIPLGARIIMISDTTDAMTTDRPYRKRLPVEAVISELQKHRGTQFDPKLVDLVVNSVTIRRTIAQLQAGSAQEGLGDQSGGSKRVQPQALGLLRGRSSWPRIRAF
jgi:HD-GYP domain-containing protein (c-di-GMP phosphodiesterase class II)